MSDWINWAWMNWREIGALLGAAGAGFAGVWAWGKLELGWLNPWTRLTKLEERLSLQETLSRMETRVDQVDQRIATHERECLRVAKENGERLAKIEEKSDKQRSKLNRIEGLIEGLTTKLR